MNATTSVALSIERHDGAYSFSDHVPGDVLVEDLTRRAAPRVRLPSTDISSGKPISYSLLHDGVEVQPEITVARAFPQRRAKVTIVHAFRNA